MWDIFLVVKATFIFCPMIWCNNNDITYLYVNLAPNDQIMDKYCSMHMMCLFRAKLSKLIQIGPTSLKLLCSIYSKMVIIPQRGPMPFISSTLKWSFSEKPIQWAHFIDPSNENHPLEFFNLALPIQPQINFIYIVVKLTNIICFKIRYAAKYFHIDFIPPAKLGLPYKI